jgi:formylglycine-generating enzyme required for sulfatase activity
MPETKRPLKVFLCHASQDKPAVRELSQRLFAEGWIDPWLDEKKLLPGQDWRLKIEEAVETTDIVIICLSSNSVSKEGFIQKELRYAKEIALEKPDETIFLIPLRLDDCETPRGLRFYQWGDYFGEMKDETYTVLLQSLELRYQQRLMLEEKARARQEKERLESEAAEKAAREKAKREKLERETAEKAAREEEEREKAKRAAQEKLEREAAERARREKAEREAAEKAARDKARIEVAAKAKRERAERRTAQIAALKDNFSKSISSFKLSIPNAMPFPRIGGIITIFLVLLWISSWAMPQIFTFLPTAEASLTSRPSATFALSNSPLPFTKTLEAKATPTQTRRSSETPTKTQVVNIPSLPPGATQISPKTGMVRIYIPAGDFTMGIDADKAADECIRIRDHALAKFPGARFSSIDECPSSEYVDEEPPHEVYIDSFWIDITEVTNAMYAKCVEAGVCQPPRSEVFISRINNYKKYPSHPVVGITWSDSQDYCAWAGGRLPREAEWEKAARGTDERIYPWGNTFPSCSYHANCSSYFQSNWDSYSVPVGGFLNGASPYGALDMSGNVSEFVSDWYDESYYRQSPGQNPSGPESGQYHVVRGGSYYSLEIEVRTTDRSYIAPILTTLSSEAVGFRCVMDVNPYP